MTLDHRMRIALEPERLDRELATLKDEVAHGLVLEEGFYQALEKFEGNPNLDARSFFTEMLKQLAES